MEIKLIKFSTFVGIKGGGGVFKKVLFELTLTVSTSN